MTSGNLPYKMIPVLGGVELPAKMQRPMAICVDLETAGVPDGVAAAAPIS